MPNPDPPVLSLSFADVLTVLIEACRLPADARTAFDARVRQLQRLNVPDRQGEDAGRLRYGIPELGALATAIRLMDAFMPPAIAARYVTERSNDLAPFLLAGAREAFTPSYLSRRAVSASSFAVFRANGLAMLGKRRKHDERGDEPLGYLRICDETRAAAVVAAVEGAGIVIDSRTYMPVVVLRWRELLLATETEFAIELDRLRFPGLD